MKNLIIRALLALAALTAVPAASFAHDGWDYREQAASAAHQLNYAADDFAQQVLWATGYSHLSADSQRFAQDAEHFHFSIESGAPYQHLMQDYYILAGSYNHLGRAFDNAHDIHHDENVHEHWHQVEHAWQDLSWAFRGGNGPVR